MANPSRITMDRLREDPAFLRALIDASPDLIALVGLDRRILLANQRAVEMLGVEQVEEIVGMDVLAFVPPAYHPQAEQDMRETMRVRGNRYFEYPVLQRDGSTIFITISTSVLDETAGLGPCYLIIARDISTQKNLELANQALLENSLAGIFVVQEDRIVFVNKVFSDLIGYSADELTRVDKMKLVEIIHPEDRQEIYDRMRMRASGEMPNGRHQFRIVRKDGSLRWLEALTVETLYNGQPAYQVSVVDLTEQKQAEAGLRETAARYQALAETSQDGIYIINRENRFLYINKRGAELLGSPPGDVVGQSREHFIPKNRGRRLLTARKKVFESGEAIRVDDQVPTSQGLCWFSTWFIPLKDESGEVINVMGVARDINARKKLELQLRRLTRDLEKRVAERTAELVESQNHLQRLTRQIVNAQEEERRRVSRELHDEAGQALISLKLSLAAMLDELPLPFPEMHERLQDAITQVDQTMNQVRTLAHSLRPPVLDVAGLNLSLQEYCREFSQRTHIPVEYHGLDLFNVPEETSISLFRFLQEALTNIIKHARASSVQVDLSYTDRHIRLTVRDDGQGFDVQDTLPGIGLEGMQERLALVRGSLQIISGRGQGTQLVAEVPWESQTVK